MNRNRGGAPCTTLHWSARCAVVENGAVEWNKNLLVAFETRTCKSVDRRTDASRKERRFSETGNWEYWLRDPNGYTVVLTSPLP